MGEYSTLTKVKGLVVVFLAYLMLYLMVNWLLQYFEASEKTVSIIHFSLLVYAVVIASFMAILLSLSVSLKIFQSLFYLSIIMIAIGIISLLITMFKDNLNLHLSRWPFLIGGLYFLFFSLLGRGGLVKDEA